MDPEQIVHDVTKRVRELVGDAEERAASIVREAEADAARIRERAEAEARKRLDEIRSAFDDLEGKLTEAEVTPGPVIVPEPAPPAVPEPTPEPPPGPEPTPEPVPEPTPPPDEADRPAAASRASDAAVANGDRSSDKAAARLVAMKMALDGASRAEIDSHLASNYDVESREKLLDDVLARAKA